MDKCNHCGEALDSGRCTNGRCSACHKVHCTDGGNDGPGHRVRVRPARKGYHLVPCPGTAHSNPHIDNCGQCAPRWGWIEVPDDWQAIPCTCDPICMDENSLPSHCHCGCERCPNQPTDTVRR